MNALALERFFQRAAAEVDADPGWPAAHEALLCALESGALRAASRRDDGTWHAHEWVKAAILAGFRKTQVAPIDRFFDKTAYPPRALSLSDGVRVVPGGTSIRRGAYLARSVVVMPPAFVNVGAFLGEGTMVDSHALVGSCAQIGKRVHLSAGAQIGGVLEPVNARPVVIEDGAFVGALAGVFEGVVVREHAVLAAGVVSLVAPVRAREPHPCARRGTSRCKPPRVGCRAPWRRRPARGGIRRRRPRRRGPRA